MISSTRVSARTARRTKTIALNVVGVLVALVTLFPVFWMLATAFKPSPEIYSLTPRLLPAHPTLGNFSQVISGQAAGIGTVWLFFRNSLAVTLAAVLIASVVSLLASVAVARFRFRFRATDAQTTLTIEDVTGRTHLGGAALDGLSVTLAPQ